MEFHRLCIGLILLSTMPSCLYFRTDFGLTAKTYDNFNKDNAEKYNYVFNADNITYKDKDNKEVVLTQRQKDEIVDNVNQCLIDAGYGYNSAKTKTINLNLDFTETETKDSEIYYSEGMVEKYDGYNYDFEPYIGPKNKTWIILREAKKIEVFWNYNGKDKVYFVGLPHYSKFGGITFRESSPIDVNCQKRSGWFCRWGKSDLSHFYAKLSGKEDNMTKFDVNLHHKINLSKREGDINKAREHIINKMSKYICLFIADNIDDLQIIPFYDENVFSIIHSALVYTNYQELKNRINNSYTNFYTVKNKLTDEYFNDVYSNYTNAGWYRHMINITHNHNIYGNKIYEFFFNRYGGYAYNLAFYENKYKLDQLEIKNN